MMARSDRSGWRNADVQRAEAAARRAFDELGLQHPTEASIDAIAYEMGALVSPRRHQACQQGTDQD